MLRKLRIILATMVAASGLVALGSAPAQAAGGNCNEPKITGVVSTYKPYRGTTSYYRFTASGFVSATCPTTFYKYKYAVNFHIRSNAGSVTTYSGEFTPVISCTTLYCYQSGTRISFPTVSLPIKAAGGGDGGSMDPFYDGLEIRLDSWRSFSGSSFSLIPTNVYKYKKPYPVEAYDTNTMHSDDGTCPSGGIDDPVVGKQWC